IRILSDQPRRVKYRVGHSLRVVYDVDTSHGTWCVTARTFGDAHRLSVAARAHATSFAGNGFPAVFEDATVGAIFWTFPNDRALTHLPSLIAPSDDLAALVPGAWQRS